MHHVRGKDRNQSALFPVAVADLVPEDHPCRVIEAFVDTLKLAELGFANARLGDTGRPPYDPADLLKLYLYGYLNLVRSSRSLERECHRNVEVMWLLGQLAPDHKTIANFRRYNVQALKGASAELVRFLRSAGLVRGEWVAIDGSKFQAVASRKSVDSPASLERRIERAEQRMEHYLAQLDEADQSDDVIELDRQGVQKAVEILRQRQVDAKAKLEELSRENLSHRIESEPEACLMRGKGPGYNLQIAVDGGSGLIVAHCLTNEAVDSRQLQPMAEAAAAAVGNEKLDVLADAGYSNGAQAAALEEQGILVHAPAQRGRNSSGEGEMFDRSAFTYDQAGDTFTCPAGKEMRHYRFHRKDLLHYYRPALKDCQQCPLKDQCTEASRRSVSRHQHDDALNRMDQRATPEAMRRRRCTVEHPFASLKYRIFGHPRLLMRGLLGAAAEMAIATTVWNLKRAISMLGAKGLRAKLA
jgi:transposase